MTSRAWITLNTHCSMSIETTRNGHKSGDEKRKLLVALASDDGIEKTF